MLELIMMRWNVMMTMMTMRMTMMCNGNVKSRKIVIRAISFNNFIQIRHGQIVKKSIFWSCFVMEHIVRVPSTHPGPISCTNNA